MTEFIYDHNSWSIIAILFVILALAIEGGYRFGRRFEGVVDDSRKSQINSLQGSMLGILALLLGFTYSLALERYDGRCDAVVDEGLAIEGALLYSKMLPQKIRDEAQPRLREFLEHRIQAGEFALNKKDKRNVLLDQAEEDLEALSRIARESAFEDESEVHSGYFIRSLNEVMDAFGRREAALEQHVPELVLWILFGTIILTGFVVGHASGVEGHRIAVTVYALVILIFLVVYLIMDLDRPRRGFVQVRQQSLDQLEKFDHLNQGD